MFGTHRSVNANSCYRSIEPFSASAATFFPRQGFHSCVVVSALPATLEWETFASLRTSNCQASKIICAAFICLRQTYLMRTKWLLSFFSVALLSSASFLPAQDKTLSVSQSSASMYAYDVNREVTVVGTVVSNSVSSKTAPAGPRVSLQTPSGLLDIHLGDARLLIANQLTIQPGDTLRIVGENIAFSGGTQFVARILQKGTQALLLRSTRGFPILSSNPRGSAARAKPGSVL
jgi:hypothetical protein